MFSRGCAVILALVAMTGVGVAQAQEEAAAYAGPPVSAEYPFESHYADVLDSKMHYVDVGEGNPILFLHGNPTWSYLWRNIIPYLEPHGRCIAPDLIGMGKSGKPDIEYSFDDHAKYLDAFIEGLGLKNITLVIHDWGSGLGFHYARRHPDNVKAIVFMEAFVQTWDTLEDMPPQGQMMFRQMRTPGVGWKLVAEQNIFVEQILPLAAGRALSKAEMDMYRMPFPEVDDRKPVWKWPNEVPIAGEPAGTAKIIETYNAWLQETNLPKLMFTVEPGFLLGPERAQWCKDHLKNLAWVHLGEGVHFVQEQYPRAIGAAIAAWYQGIDTD